MSTRATRVLAFVGACVAAGLGELPRARAQAVLGPGYSGFTCCNFHYEGDWISDANWSSLPKIPAGTPVRVLELGDNRVNVELGGRRMTLGLDYGRKQSVRTWAQRLIVPENPSETIDAWPEYVRDAVKAGRVAPGMSKEQVVVSLGYPPTHATPSMEAAEWKYWHTTHGTFLVVWDESGHVRDVIAEPSIKRSVLAAGGEPSPLSDSPAGMPVQLNDLEGLLRGAGGDGK